MACKENSSQENAQVRDIVERQVVTVEPIGEQALLARQKARTTFASFYQRAGNVRYKHQL